MISLMFAAVAGAQPVPEQVTMSLDEFLKMYEANRKAPPDPEKPPFQWSLASARYAGEVVFEGNDPVSAVFRTTLEVQNLRGSEWIRVPLLPSSVAIRSARLDGADAPIVLENGWYTLVTKKAGALQVTVDFAVAVDTTQGSSGLSFDLPASGATEFELSVPGTEDLDFTIDNAKLASDKRVGGFRVVSGTLPPTGALRVRWQREIPQAEQQQARVYAEVHTLVGVGDGVLSATATVQESILFASVDAVKLAIPDGMTVLEVRGPGLRDWQVGADNQLVAQLNFAAQGSYTLVVSLERVLPPGSSQVEVPIVEPVGVERSKGFVGIQANGSLELTPGEVTGSAPVDVRTLPATIVGVTDQPVLLGYKYLGSGAKIPLTVGEHEEVDVLVTLLDSAQATTAFTADGRRLTSVSYEVRNNRRQFLRLELPSGAELWSASVAGRAVQPAKNTDGDLLIPLIRSQAAGGALAAFPVQVVYVENGEAPKGGRGTFTAELPIADAPTTWLGWSVYVPAQAKVKKSSADGSLRSVGFLAPPQSAAVAYEMPNQNAQMQDTAQQMIATGALGQGAAPVEVRLPLDGQPLYFEKVLALDERLWVSFTYKGLDD